MTEEQQEGTVTIEKREYSHTDYDMGEDRVTLYIAEYGDIRVDAFSVPEALRKLADEVEASGGIIKTLPGVTSQTAVNSDDI